MSPASMLARRLSSTMKRNRRARSLPVRLLAVAIVLLLCDPALLAGPYVTETSGIRWNDVGGIRWNDVGGIRWNDVGGIRWNDVGGIRWNDAEQFLFNEASGIRWNDVGGIRWNDVGGQEFDDAISTGLTSVDLVLIDAFSTLPDTSVLNVIITYTAMPTAANLAHLVANGIHGGTIFRRLPMVVVNATRDQVESISTLPGVRSVYADRTLSIFDADSRALIGVAEAESDPELERPGGGPITGAGVTIAVLDTGVDATHPDLPFGPKVVQNVRLDTSTGGGIGFHYAVPVEGIPNTDLVLGHGTFVASVAAGTGAASSGRYKGVAPGASILALSAGDYFILNVLEGFDYILDHASQYGVRVVNCSWGTMGWFDPDDPVNVATRLLYDAGITVVFAAGNNGPAPDTLNAYSVAPWVIGVGSTRKNGTLSDFSSRGIFEELVYHPVLVAPGEGIIAASPAGLGGVSGTVGVADPSGGVSVPSGDAVHYTVASGTSFAAPHVAGVAALMLEADPSLTPSAIKRILQKTATPILVRDRSEVGAGRLDGWASLTQVMDGARPFGTHVPGWLDERPFRIDYVAAPVVSDTATPGAEVGVSVHPGATALAWQMSLAWGTFPGTSDLDLRVTDGSGVEIARSASFNGASLFGRTEGVHMLARLPTAATARVTFKAGVGLQPQPFEMIEESAVASLEAYQDVDSLPEAQRDIITRAVSRRVMIGRGDAFEATSPMTRAELARALALTAGRPQRVPSIASFWDTQEFDAHFPYVETVAGERAGRVLLDPYSRRIFKPKAAVSRLEFAVALVKAAGFEAEAAARFGDRLGATDYFLVPAAKRGYVAVAIDHGLMELIPYPGGMRFDPKGQVLRLDAARYFLTLLDTLH